MAGKLTLLKRSFCFQQQRPKEGFFSWTFPKLQIHHMNPTEDRIEVKVSLIKRAGKAVHLGHVMLWECARWRPTSTGDWLVHKVRMPWTSLALIDLTHRPSLAQQPPGWEWFWFHFQWQGGTNRVEFQSMSFDCLWCFFLYCLFLKTWNYKMGKKLKYWLWNSMGWEIIWIIFNRSKK